MIAIRDRVKELRMVRAGDLIPNPKNWRTHPEEQIDALQSVLDDIGFAGAALSRELEDGRLMVIDGHARREIDIEAIIPVLVTDLTEEEADKVLLTYDPISAMAEADTQRLSALLTSTANTGSNALWDKLNKIAGNRKREEPEAPEEFPEFDESIETKHTCPACNYQFS